MRLNVSNIIFLLFKNGPQKYQEWLVDKYTAILKGNVTIVVGSVRHEDIKLEPYAKPWSSTVSEFESNLGNFEKIVNKTVDALCAPSGKS